MYDFFDFVLFLPLFALPLLLVTNGTNRKMIIYTFLLTQAIIAVRRISDSFLAVAAVIAAFFVIFILQKSLHYGNLYYIVVSTDEKENVVLLFNGKSTVAFKTSDVNMYSEGEIIKIKAKYLSDFI